MGLGWVIDQLPTPTLTFDATSRQFPSSTKAEALAICIAFAHIDYHEHHLGPTHSNLTAMHAKQSEKSSKTFDLTSSCNIPKHQGRNQLRFTSFFTQIIQID
ncbi:unnamed protein product [Rhizophagus irregularis]|nr:unnamed protein product [Rhizophagus irregularis]CAB4440452.1 unnamed protein product [Rhizophagus irregularis]